MESLIISLIIFNALTMIVCLYWILWWFVILALVEYYREYFEPIYHEKYSEMKWVVVFMRPVVLFKFMKYKLKKIWQMI